MVLKALEHDEGFGPAHACLCEICHTKLYHGWTDAPEPTFTRGVRSGKKAVLLDEQDAFAHMALGRINILQGNFETAVSELEKALDLNPNLAIGYYSLGMALHWSGQAREALPLVHKAIRQSPNDPLLWAVEMHKGWALHLGHRYEDAVRWCRKACRHSNATFWAETILVAPLTALSRIDEAREAGKAGRYAIWI